MIAQAWLPEICLREKRLAQPVGDLVNLWSAHWLAGDSWSVSEHWSPMSGETDSCPAAFELENGLSCILADRGKLIIAAAMLGLPLDRGTPQKSDARLINACAGKAIDDLADRLSTLPVPATQSGTAPAFYQTTDRSLFQLTINDSSLSPIMFLHVERQFLVHLAQSLAPLRRTQAAPTPRQAALVAGHVKIGAKIGSARLSLAELRGLGVGDVIPLNQDVQTAFGLTVDGVETVKSAFQIKPDPDAIHLQLTRSLS